MKRIALDMDDVLADTHEKLVGIALNEFVTAHPKEAFYQDSFRNLLHPKQYEKLFGIINTKGFFADIPVKTGAIETVKELSKYYEIFVASAAMEFNNSFKDKFDWLDEHFPFIHWRNRVFCGNKSIVIADYLIDDHARNLENFRGQGILFTAPHNLKIPDYKRVSNWDEVGELFLPKR